MRKIISLFQRNYDGDRLVRDEVVPGAEWVLAGEGVATEKFDGTACLIRDGRLFKRHDVKDVRKRPDDWEPAQDPDPVTGHWPGWLPVSSGKPEDKWHVEGFRNWVETHQAIPDGTYELIGPKVQGNPYELVSHWLTPHGKVVLDDAPRTFDALRDYLANRKPDIEGIVWHHPDGRMVKIKAKDFGIRWPR